MARRQQMADRALRPAMRSPGRPIPGRHVEREFWRLIAAGKSTEDAAGGVGVSVPVGSRWFRHAGGMTPLPLAEPTGRYLSFAEREELALQRARGLGVRACAWPRWSDNRTNTARTHCSDGSVGGAVAVAPSRSPSRRRLTSTVVTRVCSDDAVAAWQACRHRWSLSPRRFR